MCVLLKPFHKTCRFTHSVSVACQIFMSYDPVWFGSYRLSPVHTTRRPIYGPFIRAVYTGSVYRALEVPSIGPIIAQLYGTLQ